jgi:peptidyl-prolyl cis-trans isomerase D
MLQKIRDRFTGGFAIGILPLIAVPFAFFGINYNFIDQGFAAKVNDMEISLGELDLEFRSQLEEYGQLGDLPAEYRRLVKESVLESIIQRRLFDEYIIDKGYRVGNDVVMSAIRRVPEFQDESGNFSREVYDQWLLINGFTHAQFENGQRRNMERSQLQGAIAATAFVTPEEYRRYLALYLEQRVAAAASFDIASMAEGIEVSDEDAEAWYNERPADFMSQESVDLDYVEISREDVAASIDVSEQDLLSYYESNKDRYRQDEQRRASHILIVNEDDAAAKATATEVLDRISGGEDFAALASEFSADSGSAERGGDLGFSTREQFGSELGGAIFSMNPGDVRGPVKTDFGYHVVRLDEVQQGGPLPLEAVRGELERELKETSLANIYRGQMGELSDALFDAENIATLAAATGLPVKTADNFARTGGEPFGANQAAIDAAFDEAVIGGQLSDIVELDANRAVVIGVRKYNAAERRPLEAVRDEVVAAIRNTRASEQIKARADGLAASLQAGAEFAAAVAEAGATELLNGPIARTAEDYGPLVMNAIFSALKPAPGVPTVGVVRDSNGAYVVYQVSAVIPGRPEMVGQAERDVGKEALMREIGMADFAAFLTQLREESEVIISDNAFAEPDFF